MMFRNALGFNQPIGYWNTSKVTNMDRMIHNCTGFNQDLGNWDMTGVTSLREFFAGNSVFNNGGSTGINNWRPSSCTRMDNTFYNAVSFNQPIGDWDVSSCTNMGSMFFMQYTAAGTGNFNQDIGAW